jgi:uncharacterized protein YjdB
MKIPLLKQFLSLLLLFGVTEMFATNMTVTTSADAGAGSLRAAITSLNGSAGPHNITFDPSVTIVNLTSNLPAITRQINIDGGGTVTVSVPAGDGGYTMFTIGGGGGGSTLKGMTIQNTGFIPIRITAALSDITLRDLVIKHNSNNLIDYAILCDAAMTNMLIRNVDIRNIQYGGFWGMLFNGNMDGLTIDNVDISESGGGDMRAAQFQGATNNNIVLNNCTFDIKYSSNLALFDADEGNYGIYFNNTATNVTIDSVNIPTAEIYCIRTNVVNNFNISNCSFGNSRGYGGQISVRFEGVATGVSITNTTVDQDNNASIDDGDYGIYFNTNASDIILNGVTMHDAEIHGFFVGGTLSTVSILNSTFDNFDGYEGNLMIQINGATTNLTMTNVNINEDKTGTTDDGDYGIRFIGSVNGGTINNVSVKEADIYGVHIWVDFQNVTWTGGTLLKNATGIRGDNCNYNRRNVKFQNLRIDSSSTYGVFMPVCLGGLADSVAFLNDTIRYSGTDGMYIQNGNVATLYTIKNCVVTGNGRTTTNGDGIQITAPDNVVMTQNSIYDNAGLGINHTGNGNCNMEGALAPIINSVTPLGGNMYTVNFTIPVAAGAGTYKVEFFTNNPLAGIEGEYYVSSVSGLGNGVNQTTTITTNTGPAASPKTASLTMTYTRTGASCNGTSEFSNAAALDPQGPGCVNNGIVGWYRADKITGVANGGSVSQLFDFSGSSNKFKQFTTSEQPTYFSGDVSTNFNPSITFDGTNDNFEITAGMLPFNTGGTILTSSYNSNTAGTTATLYSQNFDDPALFKWAGIPNMGIWDNGNYANYVPGMQWINNVSALAGLDYGTTSATTHGLFNGTSTGNLGGIPSPEAGIAYIGGDCAGGSCEFWAGKIHELIFYNRQLTATEKQKINSYLSVKWGVSIDSSVMKVAGAGNNYITSDGTVIWTANTSYYHHITGIGRDDCDSLLQKQSRNVNIVSPGYVTVGLGTILANNAANTNNFSADKNFTVWGDDSKAGATTTAITGDGIITLTAGTCAQFSRLAKTFRVQETGTVGVVQMKFNMNGVKLGKTAADYYLAIHSTDVFSGTIEKLVAAASYDNVTGDLVFDNVNFASNGVRFFTVVGKRVYGPANITSNLKVWLKAEDGIAGGNGTSIDTWGDQGPGGNDVIQTTAANQPIYYTTSNLINFNPSVKFDGTNDILVKATGSLTNGTVYTGSTLFSVNNSENSAAGQRIFRQAGAPGFSDINLYAPYANISIFDAPYTDRVQFSNTFFNTKSFNISTGVKDNSGTNTPAGTKQVLYNNGKSIDTGNGIGTYTGNNGSLSIGSNNIGSEFHNGFVGEMIYYSAALTAVDRQKINSYLSLKWGVSLDQTTALDYLAADGTVLWNATTNVTFKNRITGIGREDCSDLIQRQSRNQDTTSAYTTIALGTIAATNLANTNSFSVDKSFLVWGDDNVAGASTSTVTGDGTIALNPTSCGVFRRLAKTFRAVKTGTVGNVQVQVNLRGVTLGKVAADFYLAINSTATFSGVITKLVQASSYSNGIVTFNDVSFANADQFFTVIGIKAQGPANITTNLKLWLRAEDGVTLSGSGTIDAWGDQGPAANDALQATVAAQPTWNTSTNLINFNPTVSFTGSNYLRTGSNIYGTGNINYTTFGIIDHNSVAGNNYYLADGTWTTNQTVFFGHQGANQAQGNYLNDWPAGQVAVNIPYLQGFTRDATTGIKTNYQSAKSVGANTMAAINKTNNGFAEIGGNVLNTELWNGKIGEIITFQSVLTAPEQQKIYSYLAIKWGFTLDQTTPYNYVSAAGTTIWNATTYAAYKNRITGIGREDCSDLQQKQSKSVEPGALVTISNGSALAAANDLNGSSYSTDNSWLLIGDNGKGLTWTGSGVPINGGNVRLNRVWRVKETNTVGIVYLEVPDNTSSLTSKLPAATANIYLLVANSATTGKFSALSGVSSQLMTFDATNKKWYTTYNFADGDYFTFGSEKTCTAPVGISDGLTSWYHATDLATGAAGATFNDQAFSVYPLTLSGSATVVAGSATSFNYNRSITLGAGAAYSRGSLTNSDMIDPSAGSMFAVGTSNINLLGISSSASNSSGLGSSALFNNTASAYGAGIASKPNIFAMLGSITNVTGYTNGLSGIASGSIAARPAGTYTFGFGRNGSNASFNNGSIAESFTFNRVLDLEEKDVLESYLAIKYGQTLSHNYYNADYDGTNAATTTLYNISTYPNRVFGVGTDTTGCFFQKQSTSVLAGSMLKMSIHTSFAAENSGNTAVFTQDRSYVMGGDDNGSIAAWVTGGGTNPNTPAIYSGTCVVPQRISRQWKVTGTYTTPTVLFAIPDAVSTEATKLPAVTAGYSVWMVINDNADFGVNGFQQEVAMTLNGTTNNWEGAYQVAAGETKYMTFVVKNNAIATGATAPIITIAETDNSCAADDGTITSGGSALLTPTNSTAYIWNNAAVTPTLSVSPTMTTTYTVTITAANGCTASATATVTVIAPPVAAIAETDNSCTANDSQVLSGDVATLTASGGATYLWDNASTLAARVVNPTITTTYTVTVTDAGGCTATATATVAVVTATTVSLTGTNSICVGETTGVAPTSGGTWLSSDPTRATVTNAGLVTGVAAGSVTFSFTSAGSGCLSAATPPVTVNATPVVSITGASSICVGSTTSLSPNSGGTWVSSDPAKATVTNAGIVSGLAAGSATFTFTNSTTGCVSAATSAVTVNLLPVVTIIGSSTICVGVTTTLSPTTGGTWSSSDPTVASVTNGGLVTGLTAGAVTFTFTKNTSPNCSATTGTVTVNALPIVSISGVSTICAGQTTTLLPAGGGTWTSSNAGVATITNTGIVTGVSAGAATFTFTNTATGCFAITSPVNVNALPVVNIMGENSICVGSTTDLSPTTGGTWTSSNAGVATVTNAGIVTGIAAGSSTFTFTSTATGCASMATSAVGVTALPVISIAGSATICVGTTTTLSPSSGGTWASSNAAIASVTNAGVVTGVSGGTATFTFTSSTSPNCQATTSAVTVVALPVVSITGSSTICVGLTTTLSPSSGGTWMSSNLAVATVSNAGIVTGVAAGSVTFTFTSSSTTCTSVPTLAVSVNALPVVSVTGASSICIGSTTLLSPTSGGTWASSDPTVATVTNTGIITGVSAGSVTCTFTSSVTGCISSPTSVVTVNTIPSVNITGLNSICIGANSGLSPTSGGTWTSSNAVVATVTNTGVVTGVSAGTATFTFTATGSGCASAPTSGITVNATPVVSITGSSSICIDNTTTLSPTNGTWTSINPAVATVTNGGLVTGVSAGTATFIFTNSSTGCQSAPTSAVTVNAAPSGSILGAGSICVGGSTTLSPATGGTWASSDPTVATVTNSGVVAGISAGTVNFVFTNSTTGCISAPTGTVTVNALPTVGISGPSSICAGFTTGLSPSSGGTWASSNAAVATVDNSGVVTGVSAGTATFIFTSTATGCASASTTAVTVSDIPVVSITGSNSLCAGSITTLSPTSGGTWVSTNAGVATVTNAGVVTAVSAGTSTFIFTNTTTGCVSAPTSSVTVNAIPIVSIIGTNNLCIGGTTGLSPSSGGTWASSNGAVATVTNTGVVTAVSSGTATFTFTQTGNGCLSAPTSVVTVNSTPVVSITGSTTICEGAASTLSPTTGGTWTSSNAGVATVSNAGVVTGVSAGTATFTFTNAATGCMSAATPAVTVNALPSVSITGGTTICAGSTTTLSPATGGIWSSSNTLIATVTNAGVVTGVSAGTVNFTFTNSITGCVSAATLPVTVNPLPVVSITGSSSICAGGTTTVSPVTGGTWVSSNPAVAIVTSGGVVTGVSAGIAIFTFTNTTTGCVSAATSAVTVNALPVVGITGSGSICIGSATALSPTTGGTWTSSNPVVATVTNAGVVTGVSAGVATFTFTKTTTGCVSVPTSPVTVNAAPVVSITGVSSICVGFTTTLSPTAGGSWTSSNAAVATVTNAGIVTGVSAGTATFTFTNSLTGCSSAATVPVTVNATPVVSITGINSICVGFTTTLSPATGGTWTSSNPAAATVTAGGVVSGISAGSATFTFTNTSSGCASLPTPAVTVNALPTVSITGTAGICIGSSTTLSPTTGGTWTSSNPAVASVSNSGVVTGIGAGTATFTFSSSSTGCVSLATGIITVTACNSLAAIKVFLSGPYDAGVDLMTDNLRVANLIPNGQPYGGVQYSDFNYNGTETIGAGVLAVTGNNAIVDWVLVELRSSASPSTVITQKGALVQRDGDVVESSDGISPVVFVGITAGSYYVTVRHRNHLGVMTASPITLSGSSAVVINFTSSGTSNYQLSGPTGSIYAQRVLSNGKRALWEGNMSNTSGSGNQIQYQGVNSDSDEAYFRVLLDPGNITVIPNYIVNAYDRADGNLDGMVIYQGSGSDSDIPFFNVLTFPDNLFFLPNFLIFQQIP